MLNTMLYMLLYIMLYR